MDVLVCLVSGCAVENGPFEAQDRGGISVLRECVRFSASIMMEKDAMPEGTLKGRVALVTGAARRIGRAVAVQADLGDISQIKRLIAETGKQFGRLDILVNSAANFLPASIVSTTEQVWDASLNTNLKAAFFCAQAGAPLLKRSHGVIINFADVGGLLAWIGYIPHCVSKAGVIMLTRCLAKELAPEVRVNAIAPGTITMPGDPPEWEEDFIKRAPLRRSGRPSDVEETVVFLVRSEFITGQVIVVDGGRTL